MSYARDERHALVETLVEVGPDAPTLCTGWSARDLAAHLATRERRPDAAPGIMLAPFARHTESVQAGYARQPWSRLLDEVRTGPPWWSPFRLIDAQANLAEMFVHHEDVRRGGPGWEPRTLPEGLEDALWSLVTKIGRLSYRKAPVTVRVRRTDRSGAPDADVHSSGSSVVTLVGPPSELLLHAFGRDEVRLDFVGDPADIEAVRVLDRGM
ncbi:TIGR03085 family metal-binding protein [Rhodococcus sp. HNM0569]|uniref:TIGR03085 family metal-binding protein n=1 Tax=Rhodococcus sp. HNM0569 TaxID=2716340 RepID=UPI00146BDE19|nr:TIGR03085 family protein [Rhodococcus sp. HNM0569]